MFTEILSFLISFSIYFLYFPILLQGTVTFKRKEIQNILCKKSQQENTVPSYALYTLNTIFSYIKGSQFVKELQAIT